MQDVGASRAKLENQAGFIAKRRSGGFFKIEGHCLVSRLIGLANVFCFPKVFAFLNFS